MFKNTKQKKRHVAELGHSELFTSNVDPLTNFTPTLAYKSIQMMVRKFHLQHDQTAMLQNDKIQPGIDSEIATIHKNNETNQIIIIFLHNHLVFLAEIFMAHCLIHWFSECSKCRRIRSQ